MSVRREIRLRKEFLYKKQQEKQLAITSDKKRKIKDSLDNDKVLPTELLSEARDLHHQLEMDIYPPASGDADEDGVQVIDDEYANIGLREPKICITTSRDPGSRLKQFVKEIKLCIPNSQVINRGTYRIDELVNACKNADFTDLIVINETRGNPDGLVVSHLPYGPTAYFTLANAVLRHDIPECKPASQAYPQLIIDGLNSKIGKRLSKIIQALYPIPKPESQRVITYANNNDYISFRHHMYKKEGKDIKLIEAGPRFELKPYEIRLGTVDQEEAEKEWILHPFMNTSRKKQTLSH